MSTAISAAARRGTRRRIIWAWILTIPASALVAAAVFLAARGLMAVVGG